MPQSMTCPHCAAKLTIADSYFGMLTCPKCLGQVRIVPPEEIPMALPAPDLETQVSRDSGTDWGIIAFVGLLLGIGGVLLVLGSSTNSAGPCILTLVVLAVGFAFAHHLVDQSRSGKESQFSPYDAFENETDTELNGRESSILDYRSPRGGNQILDYHTPKNDTRTVAGCSYMSAGFAIGLLAILGICAVAQPHFRNVPTVLFALFLATPVSWFFTKQLPGLSLLLIGGLIGAFLTFYVVAVLTCGSGRLF